jgi:hypothetical protein
MQPHLVSYEAVQKGGFASIWQADYCNVEAPLLWIVPYRHRTVSQVLFRRRILLHRAQPAMCRWSKPPPCHLWTTVQRAGAAPCYSSRHRSLKTRHQGESPRAPLEERYSPPLWKHYRLVCPSLQRALVVAVQKLKLVSC